MQVVTHAIEKVELRFNWRHRLRLFLGLPLTIETSRVTTLTHSQSYITVYIGEAHVIETVCPVRALNRIDNMPAVPWSEIIS